jgi:tetratricopeptide (TPR) repeat protein
MTLSRKWLALTLVLGTTAPIAAQESSKSTLTGSSSTGASSSLRGTPVPHVQTAMYEDIEIMKRILSRDLHAHQQAACAACHGPSRVEKVSSARGDEWFITKTPANSPMAVDVDGTYLKDYGVVFHVTMPPMLPVKTQTANKPATKPVSDWEHIRKELHGEKVAHEPAPPQQKVPDLRDVLLKILSEQGPNFTRLGDKEKLTVIVTFRPTADPHAVHGIHLGSISSPNGEAIDFLPRELALIVRGESTNRGKSIFGPSVTSKSSAEGLVQAEVGDFELLGDLQIKQGRVQEAIQAYQKAVEAQADGKRKASLYQKMAQAYLKLDDKSGTAGELAKAIEYLLLAKQNAGSASVPAPAASAPRLLTSKIIVTVPKSLLDAAAKGLAFDEFRKAAHVERITIPAPEKQGDGKRSAAPSPAATTSALDAKSGITVALRDGTVTAVSADKKILWQNMGRNEARSLTINDGHVELGPDPRVVLDLYSGKILSTTR